MKLLIIGGTRFVGRHIVESAIERGHEVTLFHRGHTGAGLFAVEEILGDRDGETDKLAGRKWDAVIDTCGYHPRAVQQSAYVLSDNVDLYCFISTISVYAEKQPGQGSIAETDKVIRFDEAPTSEEITGESYGGFKVLCEDVIDELYPDKALHIRPGLVVGPHDPSDRFTYWIDRYQRRGEVLIPDRADQPIQFIDARDLAEFTVRMVEEKATGAFNATGPAHATTLGDMWSVCKQGCGGLPEEVVASDEFLKEHDVKEWVDLPFVVMPDGVGMMDVNIDRALDRGLTIRRMAETVMDTSEWHTSRGVVELKAGMTREREAELLQLLK